MSQLPTAPARYVPALVRPSYAAYPYSNAHPSHIRYPDAVTDLTRFGILPK
ncbi:hypothetical protein OKW46_001861 [Paraburkholderia sp. WSM4179]|nr:hypothetical protein [Paraburkholderia sp. WSM4179]